jgi:hypothetical protein
MASLIQAGSSLLQQEMIVAVSVFQNTSSVPAMIIAVTSDLSARIINSVREP